MKPEVRFDVQMFVDILYEARKYFLKNARFDIYRLPRDLNINHHLKMASDEVDILSIHENVMKKFENERENLELYKKRKKAIEKAKALKKLQFSTRRNIQKELERISKKIQDIETRQTHDFYVMETAEILQKYTNILTRPRVVSFMGVVENRVDDKRPLIKSYLRIAHSFLPSVNVLTTGKQGMTPQVCESCQSNELLDLDGFVVCVDCGKETSVKASSSSYKDAERVNVGSKYTYDKRIHFRDCMNQYQGKQNSTIPQKVYDDLINEFELHGLLEPSERKRIKFSRITKEHILMFLKESKHAKHYEDAVLIHYTLTGKKPPDIANMENAIMSDFDQLVETYEKLYRDRSAEQWGGRKNFINNQYVLYQLLTKHGHPCDISEFNILKTVERKTYHDEICRELFRELGWNFVSVF